MKKIVNVAIVAAAIAMLIVSIMVAGCGHSENVQNGYSETIQTGSSSAKVASPNMLEVGDILSNYYYLVDTSTGIVYLAYNGYQRFGMTAYLNADGTPVTADQLGITLP